jgi:DNA-binding FrmR family transcriptional regulator
VDQVGSYGYRKDAIGKRLRRVEGQVRGVQRMVQQEQYCIDILTQVAAIQSALHKVSVEILRDHINGCVREGIAGDGGDELTTELVNVVDRFVALRQ